MMNPKHKQNPLRQISTKQHGQNLKERIVFARATTAKGST